MSEQPEDQPAAPLASLPGSAPDAADPFASSLAGLEAHVAAADLAGEAVSPMTREMLARLRELSGAVRALTESLGQAPADAPGAEPGPR